MQKEVILPRDQRQNRELVPENLEQPLSWSTIFGNQHPVELEIGIGKGLFLMHSAKTNPERNYVGIEYARKYFNRAKVRIEKRPIDNIRLICAEAQSFLDEYVPSASLAAIHLYFPDPWPKKRHNKRRIFKQHFIESCYRMLVPGGLLLVATDHADYWEWMQEVLAKQTILVPSEQRPSPAGQAPGLTNYEIKYIQEGRPIYRTGYQKPHDL